MAVIKLQSVMSLVLHLDQILVQTITFSNTLILFEYSMPVFSSETYPGWLTQWGQNWAGRDTQSTVNEFEYFISNYKSFSMFLAFGGSNFGLTAGAGNNDQDIGFSPDITSYDYDAPTQKYFALRDMFKSYVNWDVPDVPEIESIVTVDQFTPKRFGSLRLLYNSLPKQVYEQAQNFQVLNQNQGIVVYTFQVQLKSQNNNYYMYIDKVRDFAKVYFELDNQIIFNTTLNKIYNQNQFDFDYPKNGINATVTIFIEAFGYFNFGHSLFDNKGIIGNIYFQNKVITKITHTLIPLQNIPYLKPSSNNTDSYNTGMEIEEEKYNQSHLLCDEIKWDIVHGKKEGKSDRQTAKEVGERFNRTSINHKQVSKIWEKYQQFGNVDNRWSSDGRPRAMNEEETQELLEYCSENRTLTTTELKNDLNIDASIKTINNVLTQNGYHSYKAPKKLILTQQNIQKRQEFANEYKNWTIDDWLQVIFSDESSFCIINSDGRVKVRRLKNEQFLPDTVQAYSQYGAKLMVWGCISRKGVGPLVRITGTLNGDEYLHIIRYRLKKYYPELFTGEMFWQEDNARPHKKQNVQNWFQDRRIEVFNWPPQSPDMSIIEDIWNLIKRRIKGIAYSNVDDLWKDLLNVWQNITQEEVLNLYEGLPRRIDALLVANGNHTKY
ncbi:hypothetical protein ABPG72_016879 [Tetrahymena utriculariae]